MSNKDTVRQFLKDKGLSEKAIAGVMGNIQQESNFSTTSVNRSSGAYGLFQWLGSRKNALFQYANKNNSDVNSIETQLNFFWYELNTTEKKTKNELLSNKYNSASDYATAFEKTFERSGGSALSKRQSYAESIFSEYAGNSDNISEVVTNESESNFGLKWWGDIVKVVFVIGLILTGVFMIVLSVKGGQE